MKSIVLAAALLLVGCGGKKNVTEGERTPAAAPGNAVEPGRTSALPNKLCIDPQDIQIEPLDLEALDDELPPVAPEGALAERLAGLAEHGSPLRLDSGTWVVPAVRCQESACEAGILTMDAAGHERGMSPLPGLSRTLAAGTRLELVTARADVNSDGKPDLWIGYQQTGGSHESTTQDMAAFALPGLELQWHGVLSRTTPGAEGCEGVLYPVDADCDGDGDLVLVQRCGPTKCLNDDSHDCTDSAIQDRITTYLWDPGTGTYH